MKNWQRKTGRILVYTFLVLNVIAAILAYKLTHFYSNVPKVSGPYEKVANDNKSERFSFLKFPKSIVEDSLLVPHETVYIKTSDQIQLEAWYLDSQKDDTVRPNIGTILMFHGYGSCSSGIIKEAEAFYNLGWNVLMVDFRSHGNSEGTASSIGYRETRDVKAAFDFIKMKKGKQIVLWGISMGAATILKATAEYDLKPSKMILEMPFGTMLDATEGRLRSLGLPGEPMGVLLTFWGGFEQGFWALGFKPEDDATHISCPVLLQWGILDKRVKEGEINTIYKNLASHEKILVKYEHSGHESLCKKETLKWTETICNFLK